MRKKFYGDWAIKNESIVEYRGKDADVIVPSRIGDTEISEIGRGAFSPIPTNLNGKIRDSGRKIRSALISEGIKVVQEDAFFLCENLIEVTLPDSVKSIDIYAFKCCRSLETVKMPKGNISVGNCAFAECNA